MSVDSSAVLVIAATTTLVIGAVAVVLYRKIKYMNPSNQCPDYSSILENTSSARVRSSSSSSSSSSPASTPSSLAPPPLTIEIDANRFEVLVSKLIDLRRGSVQEVDLSEHYKGIMVNERPAELKIALSRLSDGRVFATGSKCTHYAAPMAKGALSGERLVCPWHAACFNVTTGDIEDAPGLDSLVTFPVRVDRSSSSPSEEDSSHVYVTLPRQPPASLRRSPGPRHGCPAAVTTRGKVVVVIGGGAAAAAAVETIRLTNGFDGRILVLSNEKDLPYDRVKLSKNFALKRADSILLRNKDFYEQNRIEIIHDSQATRVDFESNLVTYQIEVSTHQKTEGTEDEEVDPSKIKSIRYDYLLIASGGVPRQVRCAGHRLQGIYTLRYPSDTAGIAESLDFEKDRKKRVVIIGSSFIGMEAAACLRQTRASQVESIIVVGMEKVPFERVLGKDLGEFFLKLHQSKNIDFRLQKTLRRYIPSEQNPEHLGGVELDDGEILPADVVIVGAGIIPSTEFLRHNDPMPLGTDGGIFVDQHLRFRFGNNGKVVENVFAAGDVARFPYFLSPSHDSLRIEHWNVAQQQGRVAAENMMRNETSLIAYETVPFFWTVQFGLSLRYVGNAMTWDRIIVKGDLTDLQAKKFVAYFVTSDDRVIACATLNADPVAVVVSELMRSKRVPSPKDLEINPLEYILEVEK